MPRKGIPVESVSSDALELTQVMLKDLREQMQDLENVNIKGKQELSGILTKLMRAAATMIKEVRAMVKDAHTLVESMEYDKQAVLVVEITRSLPPEVQKAIRAELGW